MSAALIAVVLLLSLPMLASAATLTATWTDNTSGSGTTHLERRDTGAFAEIAALAPGVTTYADATAVPGIQYCYRVRAKDPAKVRADSAYSTEACGSVAIVIPPPVPAPTNLRIVTPPVVAPPVVPPVVTPTVAPPSVLAVTITSPVSGATLRGIASVTVTVSGAIGAVTLVPEVGSTNLLTMVGNVGPTATFTFDTKQFPNAPHTLWIRATDSMGRTVRTSIPIVIANP